MGQQAKGPRLVLKRGAGRPPIWFVRHGLRMRSTGMPENRRSDAETALSAYCKALDVPAEHRMPTENACPDVLYFISCDVYDFPVKIGVTSNLSQRIAALRTALPYRLALLAATPGDADAERRLHTGFADSRLEGEWFARSPELMEVIKSYAAQLWPDQEQDEDRTGAGWDVQVCGCDDLQ